MPELEIIGGAISNYVWTCRIAAIEKGVPYRLTEVWPHTPPVNAIHPLGKIPVMRHGEIELFESRAICAYIDRVFEGPALIPGDPVQTALAEQWISLINTSVDPVCMRQYVLGYAFPGTPDGSPDRPRIDRAMPALEKLLDVLARACAPGHLVGESFTLADAFLLPILHYTSSFPEGGRMVEARPELSGYLAHHRARPSVVATKPPPPPKP